MTIKKFASFLVLSGLTVAAITAMMNHKIQDDNQEFDSSTEITQKFEKKEIKSIEIKPIDETEVVYTINNTTNLSNEQIEELNKVGNFKLKDGLKDNQIAREVAQLKLEKNEYLQSLISEAEGFRSGLYNDNIGYAFGNGWNVSMQTKQTNERVASLISKDDSYIKKLSSLSGNKSTNNIEGLIDVKIKPQQSMQASTFLSYNFKSAFISALSDTIGTMKKNKTLKNVNLSDSNQNLANQVFNKLESNEQSSLVYHTYKVGGYGVTKYKGLLTSVVKHATEKTNESAIEVAKNFTYKYKLGTEIKEDIRASVLVSSMFLHKNVFAKMINKDIGPVSNKELSSIPQFKQYNINPTTNITIDNIPDPVGEYKQKMIEEGKPFQIETIVPLPTKMDDISNENNNENKSKKRAGYSMFGFSK